MNSKRRYSYSGNLTTAHWDRYSFNYTCVIKSSCFLSYWCDVRYAPGTTSPWQKATAGNFLSAESSLMRATYRSYKLRELMPDCWRWYQQHAIPLEVHVKLISFMSLMLKVMSDVSHCHLFPHLFELFFLFLFPPSLEVHLKLIRCMIFRLKFMLDVSHFHLLPSIWTSSFFSPFSRGPLATGSFYDFQVQSNGGCITSSPFLTSFGIFFSFIPSRSFLCLSVLCSWKPHQATSLKYVGPTYAKQLTIGSRQESKKRVDVVVNTHHINL